MTKKQILEKIKKSQLGGRGGASFPVYLKWQAVKKALNKKRKNQAYIIINAAEGEPNLAKDGFILENHFSTVLKGIKLSLRYFNSEKIDKIYCFIRKDYYQKNKKSFNNTLKQKEFLDIKEKFTFFIKPDSNDYMAGEESVLLNIIENEPEKPRLKPPFPGEAGLFNCPTLIHNVETYYSLGKISDDSYENNRFYYISGEVKNPGLFKLKEDLSAKEVLKASNNWPKKRFFAQLGGDACGQVLLDNQLDTAVEGSGSITLYPLKASVAEEVLKRWLDFHCQQSCGQCIPCREGTYRLNEMFLKNHIKSKNLSDLVYTLKFSSFCAFGKSLADVLHNFFVNIYPQISKNSKINIEETRKKN